MIKTPSFIDTKRRLVDAICVSDFREKGSGPIAELEPGTERLRLMITKPIRMPWWNLSDSAIFFALEMVGMQSSAIASWDLQIRRKWLPPPKGWWQLRTRPLVAWIFNATWPSHKMLEAKKKGRLIYNLNIEIHTAPWFLAVLHIVFHRKSLSTAGRCTPSNCEPLNFPTDVFVHVLPGQVVTGHDEISGSPLSVVKVDLHKLVA